MPKAYLLIATTEDDVKPEPPKADAPLLLSHPSKTLAEHIQEVDAAIQAIFARHSSASLFGEPSIQAMARRLARLHDLGKALPAFQTYIRDPKGYQGQPCEKAHTPASFLLTLACLQREGVSPLDAFALGQAVLGHHTRLRTFSELQAFFDTEDRLYPTEVGFPLIDRQALAGAAHEPGITQIQTLQAEDFRSWVEDSMKEEIEALPLREAFVFRLRVQALFSVLLEADKAYLIVSDQEKYLQTPTYPLSQAQIDIATASLPQTPLSQRREEARQQVLSSLPQQATSTSFPPQDDSRIEHLILPTGMGKTLAAASWAMAWRERTTSTKPKVIVVLPFLSVIEQTEKIYRRLFGLEAQGSGLLASHSLSERVYDDSEDTEAEFFLETWRSEIVLTTYDQLLLAMFSPKTRYQMRFHALMDALLILDELQCLPCALWQPVEQMLSALTSLGNTRVLAMSATLPPFLEGSRSLLSKEDIEAHRRSFSRYSLHLQHQLPQTLETLAERLKREMAAWKKDGLRVLITLNTRSSARRLRDLLAEEWSGFLFFVSADVTPKDRLASIERLREIEGEAAAGHRRPCLVISTQCVEAGVDLDMDLVIRDFAPLDSLIQIAGRCNRHRLRPRSRVEIVEITKGGKPYSSRIYDAIHLSITRTLLSPHTLLHEEDLGVLSDTYFARLKEQKDTGKKYAETFATWEKALPVRKLLRGEEAEQITFVISQRAPEITERLSKAFKLPDRWERRRALRSLAPEIAAVSVTIDQRRGFDPCEIATPCGSFYLLTEERLYTPERGLDLEGFLGGDHSTFDF